MPVHEQRNGAPAVIPPRATDETFQAHFSIQLPGELRPLAIWVRDQYFIAPDTMSSRFKE